MSETRKEPILDLAGDEMSYCLKKLHKKKIQEMWLKQIHLNPAADLHKKKIAPFSLNQLLSEPAGDEPRPRDFFKNPLRKRRLLLDPAGDALRDFLKDEGISEVHELHMDNVHYEATEDDVRHFCEETGEEPPLFVIVYGGTAKCQHVSMLRLKFSKAKVVFKSAKTAEAVRAKLNYAPLKGHPVCVRHFNREEIDTVREKETNLKIVGKLEIEEKEMEKEFSKAGKVFRVKRFRKLDWISQTWSLTDRGYVQFCNVEDQLEFQKKFHFDGRQVRKRVEADRCRYNVQHLEYKERFWNSIRVYGIPTDSTEEDLRYWFGDYGQIFNCRVERGLSQLPSGFIIYNDDKDAHRMKEALDGVGKIEGQQFFLSVYDSRAVRHEFEVEKPTRSLGNIEFGLHRHASKIEGKQFSPLFPSRAVRLIDFEVEKPTRSLGDVELGEHNRHASTTASSAPTTASSATTTASSANQTTKDAKLNVCNIPYDVDEKQLHLYFKDKFDTACYARVFKDEEGMSKGKGFVLFKAKIQAEEAAKGKHFLQGRRLYCDLHKQDDHAIPQSGNEANRKQDTKLHVGNIPFKVKYEEVLNYFRDKYDTAHFAKIFYGPDGKFYDQYNRCTGRKGFVLFKDKTQAETATRDHQIMRHGPFNTRRQSLKVHL
jgi:RNA recognition motif-containing protein